MAQAYSTYEAKAKFSEVMRKVRAGQHIIIEYRGEPVAEIRPIDGGTTTLEKTLARLEDRGIISRVPRRAPGAFRPLVKRPGALKRFLESRE